MKGEEDIDIILKEEAESFIRDLADNYENYIERISVLLNLKKINNNLVNYVNLITIPTVRMTFNTLCRISRECKVRDEYIDTTPLNLFLEMVKEEIKICLDKAKQTNNDSIINMVKKITDEQIIDLDNEIESEAHIVTKKIRKEYKDFCKFVETKCKESNIYIDANWFAFPIRAIVFDYLYLLSQFGMLIDGSILDIFIEDIKDMIESKLNNAKELKNEKFINIIKNITRKNDE